ncbi:MAG: glycosyltransferase family 2 protein [Candidatus Sungbacteria bacterium]|uniref:Glycosyltransferase family 2 protein n=1 Tax=Candidatus Sungiibacteriota bacterium TaxID=2750080 RepID=A0A9D6QSB3_9BACT|nr:glycosyltransferase family 2 protein [Candidatus Sungbacteria bacterium]
MKISCVIPAYNEDKRIGSVLEIASRHPLISETIVVDDGSQDDTKDVAAKFANVHLIVHPLNRGKNVAVCTGVRASSGECILFLDADLLNLTEKNITDLIEPILSNSADVSISLRGNTPFLWRLIGLDYISGERVLPRQMLTDHLNEISALPGFGLEVFLNTIIVEKSFRIKIVSWPNVASPYKYKKYGLWSGLRGDIRMMRNIFQTVSPLGVLRQIFLMRILRVE